MPQTEFVRRFGLLADASAKDVAVEDILAANEIDSSTYRIGSSQVMFRCGVLNQLEAKRDELLSDRITQLQAVCRGYLMRKKLAQRRVQEMAVRCIQRNVRAFLTVREWPWWRLLVRVTPLLNVHRTEEQLKQASDELQTLRSKLDKSETERTALKSENGRLELKVSAESNDQNKDGEHENIMMWRMPHATTETVPYHVTEAHYDTRIMRRSNETETHSLRDDVNRGRARNTLRSEPEHNKTKTNVERWNRATKKKHHAKMKRREQHEQLHRNPEIETKRIACNFP